MKESPYKQHSQQALYDWATESGWTDLRYDKTDCVIRGFPPRALTEENVPLEELLEFLPIECREDFSRISNRLLDLELKVAQALATAGLHWQTNNAEEVSVFMSQNPSTLYSLAMTRQEHDFAKRYIHLEVARQVKLTD